MGSRGPPRTPTAILKARGSWLVKHREETEPKPPRGRPTCPRWLKNEARAEWKRLVVLLDDMGVITKADGNALSRYCKLLERWKRMEAFIEENGETYQTMDRDGMPAGRQVYPQVKLAHELAVQLGRLEGEFGMTPASRSRVSVQDAAAVVFESAIDARKARFFPTAERQRARVTEEARRRAPLPPE